MDSFEIDQELLIPVGRHTLPPEVVSARQRERLLRAMTSCVSERGYRSTTLADVVRVARVSRSAFYEHFTDKAECFLKAYERMAAAFIKASLDAAASEAEWQAKLEAGISTYFRWMAEHPEVAISTVVEIHNAGYRGLEARSSALEQWMRTIEGVAILARRDGAEVPELGEVAYAAIILTAEAYVHDYARRGCVDRVQEMAPRVQSLARTLFANGVAAG
jgi:AcrR family transcriptional regulator